MAWKALTDAALAVGQILTSEKSKQLRDNPAAVAAGAVSAAGNRIKPSALDTYRQAASVNFTFTGYYVTSGSRVVERYEGGDGGRGKYFETVTTRTAIRPATSTTASKEADITDMQARAILQVIPGDVVLTGDYADNTDIVVTPVDWTHPLGSRISRSNFTLVLTNDPRSSTEPKAVTGTLSYDIIYVREDFWIPDSQRPA